MNYSVLKRQYHMWFVKTRPLPAVITYAVLLLLLCSQLRSTRFNGLLILSGWANWTLMEYLLHRFLFHYKTYNRHLKFLRYLLHDVHHRSPGNTLFIPLIIRWLALLQAGFVCQYLAGAKGYYLFAGYAWGMFYYMLIHWVLHLKKTPSIFRALKKHHIYHHLVNPHAAFGVTTTFWDWLFNTLPEAGKAAALTDCEQGYYSKV